MLFDWGPPRDSTMWMRNTVAPLDMVFINADGTIRRIAENTVPRAWPSSTAAARCARRWSWRPARRERLDIRVGDKVEQRDLRQGADPERLRAARPAP